MFKVNNTNMRTWCEICSTPCSIVSIVNFEKVNADWVAEYERYYYKLRQLLQSGTE